MQQKESYELDDLNIDVTDFNEGQIAKIQTYPKYATLDVNLEGGVHETISEIIVSVEGELKEDVNYEYTTEEDGKVEESIQVTVAVDKEIRIRLNGPSKNQLLDGDHALKALMASIYALDAAYVADNTPHKASNYFQGIQQLSARINEALQEAQIEASRLYELANKHSRQPTELF